jgi:hypothetical protein
MIGVMLARVSAAIVAAGVMGWSGARVLSASPGTWGRLARLEPTAPDAAIAVHAVLLVASALLLVEIARVTIRRSSPVVSAAMRPAGLLAAGLVIAPGGPAVEITPPPTVVPAGTVVSPAVAAAVMERILRARREQVRRGFWPDRFDTTETAVLGAVVRTGRDAAAATEAETDDVVSSSPDLTRLLAAVERPDPSPGDDVAIDHGWLIQVRVLGHPVAENRSGERAVFRKSRALELLTWMVLNRDRCRRSAARTAMWEMDVSDATFSTIVSDMRRALGEVALPPVDGSWCPPTFSDELVLGPHLVTDADLLADAASRLRRGETSARRVAVELARVRDIPLAGTSYSWADLDGTTTRLVVLVVETVRQVASTAAAEGDVSTLLTAASAGLRVLPGCEEFLDLQASVVPRSLSRSPSDVAG